MEAAVSAAPEAGLDRPPSFRERFVGVLVRPRETFARMGDPDAWFWPAILLLVGYILYYLAIGVGTARWQASFMGAMLARTRQPNPSAQNGQAIMLAVMPVTQLFAAMLQVPVTIAASWAVRTVAFYGLARLLGGAKPHWARVVAMVGWAWTPLFFQYALLGILMLTVPQVLAFFLPLPKEPTNPAPMRTAQSVQFLLYLSPFVFWNLALCVIGVGELFRLPRWKACLVVLVPTVAQLLFLVAMYFISLAMMDTFGMGTMPTPPAPNGPSR
ncbi:MAG TPA: Yip1 family protein [Armatimonadota bacterium]|nr:Yip1 family protein [Armatimonadota bacterium]